MLLCSDTTVTSLYLPISIVFFGDHFIIPACKNKQVKGCHMPWI